MSYGLVICSKCHREVHQWRDGWGHCEDKTPICADAKATYPATTKDIEGRWCGMDDFDRKHDVPTAITPTDCPHKPTRGIANKLNNVCQKCGATIMRRCPAGAWKDAA